MSQTHAVGIDLGTTYSAVAHIDDSGHTAMIRNGHGDLLTPSVVLFEDREVVVGKEAKKLLGVQGDRVADCAKRDMGQPRYHRPIRGEMLPPEVIQSCILRKLRNDTAAVLGSNFKVVITVPAYFDEPRRKATTDAGEMAGLEVLDIVNEPTAAALAFGEQLGYLDPAGAPKQPMKVLVYDLGGGTFDVTVIDLAPGNIRTLATDGDVQLGGRDWDLRLVDFLAEQFIRQHAADPRLDPASQQRMIRAAEEAKHTLSARNQASVHIESAGRSCDIPVTRQQFEELTEDLIERTACTTRQVLNSAKLQWRDIAHILLVGGSTRMPKVSRMLEALSGLKPDPTVYPDEAVARGAAIFAGYLLKIRQPQGPPPKFQVIDVNSHSLGIEGVDQRTDRKENVVLIPRNTALPCRVTEKFVTKRASQPSVIIQVLEGDNKDPRQCSPVGRAVIRPLPVNLPQGWPVEVTYSYGTNGRLSVRATVPGTQGTVQLEMERESGLSDDRVARWRQIVVAEQGFDAFESMLDEVLGIAGPAPTRPTVAVPTAATAAYAAAPVAAAASGGLAQGRTGAASPTGNPATAAMGLAPPSPAGLARTNADAGSVRYGAAPQQPAALLPTPAAAPAASSGGAAMPQRPRITRYFAKGSTVKTILSILGHLAASTLGLVIGYYILCLITPQGNFLNLPLPGLSRPAPEK